MVKKEQADNEEQSQKWDEYLAKKSKITIYIVTITIGMIILFGGLGYVIDRYLGTKPFVMIVLLAVSFPLNQVVIYKKVKKDILK